MTREEMMLLVPVVKGADAHYVRVRDIPNPWRSEFANDSIDAEQPTMPGEAACYFVGDWIKWLALRFEPEYKLLYDGVLYYEITDAELDDEARAQ
ncbi:hypothetical protein [Caballeronia grimmiae]|uniref:hypothetical protein n=1 Tax=Caballeronia grimmiae TaxID=1071679 RepID=UPI0038BCD8A8